MSKTHQRALSALALSALALSACSSDVASPRSPWALSDREPGSVDGQDAWPDQAPCSTGTWRVDRPIFLPEQPEDQAQAWATSRGVLTLRPGPLAKVQLLRWSGSPQPEVVATLPGSGAQLLAASQDLALVQPQPQGGVQLWELSAARTVFEEDRAPDYLLEPLRILPMDQGSRPLAGQQLVWIARPEAASPLDVIQASGERRSVMRPGSLHRRPWIDSQGRVAWQERSPGGELRVRMFDSATFEELTLVTTRTSRDMTPALIAQDVYWVDEDGVWRQELGTGQRERLIEGPSRACGPLVADDSGAVVVCVDAQARQQRLFALRPGRTAQLVRQTDQEILAPRIAQARVAWLEHDASVYCQPGDEPGWLMFQGLDDPGSPQQVARVGAPCPCCGDGVQPPATLTMEGDWIAWSYARQERLVEQPWRASPAAYARISRCAR